MYCEGERNETAHYYFEGYVYHKDPRNPYIFRCQKRSSIGCNGRLHVQDDDLTVDLATIVEHRFHQPDPIYLEKEEWKAELYRRCRQTQIPLEEIFRNMCREYVKYLFLRII